MQLTMDIDGTWSVDRVLENYKTLCSELMWKNFKIIFKPDIYESSGYFVFSFQSLDEKEKFSINLYRHRIQISSNSAFGSQLCFVFLGGLLRENDGNIFFDTLLKYYRNEKKLPIEFQKASIEIATSHFVDLVEGNIPKERFDATRKMVKNVLLSMLDALEEIGN